MRGFAFLTIPTAKYEEASAVSPTFLLFEPVVSSLDPDQTSALAVKRGAVALTHPAAK